METYFIKRHRATKRDTAQQNGNGTRSWPPAAPKAARSWLPEKAALSSVRAGVSAGPRKCVCVPAGMRKKENGAPCGAAVKQGHWQVAFLRIP